MNIASAPVDMIFDNMVRELEEAIRDIISDASEDPENAFVDLASDLARKLSRKSLTILPINRREQSRAAERICTVLTECLRKHPDYAFATRIANRLSNTPFQLQITTPTRTHTFRGAGVQDAYAQAAQAILLEEL